MPPEMPVSCLMARWSSGAGSIRGHLRVEPRRSVPSSGRGWGEVGGPQRLWAEKAMGRGSVSKGLPLVSHIGWWILQPLSHQGRPECPCTGNIVRRRLVESSLNSSPRGF